MRIWNWTQWRHAFGLIPDGKFLKKQDGIIVGADVAPGSSLVEGTDYIKPGEPLTPGVGEDNGIGYSSPDLVPIFAFRKAGDTRDRIIIWANGQIVLGNGTSPPNAVVYVDGSGDLQLNGGGDAIKLNATGIGFFSHAPAAQPTAIADIASPVAATAEDVALKVNAILAALRAPGSIAT